MSANKLCQRCGVTMFYSTEVFCQDCQEAQMARDPVTPAMTAKRNTDVVPVTGAVNKAYRDEFWRTDSTIAGLYEAINASPELTKLIAENERMRKSLKAMYNAVYQLRGALVYINEMEEVQRILGEQP